MTDKDKTYSITIDNPKLIKTVLYYREHPEELFKLEPDNMRLYLRGVFDANADIYINSENIAIIGLFHNQPEKINVFHKMLKQFEVNSVVFHPTSKNFSEPSQLFIIGLDDIVNFWEQIGMENQKTCDRFSNAWDEMLKVLKKSVSKE